MISISILMFLSFVLLNSLTISCNISPSDAVNPFQKVKVTSLSESDSAELPPPQAPKIPVATTNKEPINHFLPFIFCSSFI